MMQGKNSDLLITVLVASLLLLFLILVPQTWIFSGMIICPTRWLFHISCPLCGITRASWLFLHLKWAEAWQMNPGIFPLFLFYLFLVSTIIKSSLNRFLAIGLWTCIILMLAIYVIGFFI